MKVREAFGLLGLRPTATAVEVKAAYHKLARELHPDHGGDASRMAELTEAAETAQREADKPAECPSCGGGGRISTTMGMGGFTAMLQRCPICKGSGAVSRAVAAEYARLNDEPRPPKPDPPPAPPQHTHAPADPHGFSVAECRAALNSFQTWYAAQLQVGSLAPFFDAAQKWLASLEHK